MTFSSDRVKHLEFIQATISRQASHSFAVKGWSLTVAAGLYAYTASNLSWKLAVFACLPPIAFAWLDFFYLRQERLFRELYRDAIRPDSDVPVFDMNTEKYQDRQSFPKCRIWNVISSKTYWPFHLTIELVGLALFTTAILQ